MGIAVVLLFYAIALTIAAAGMSVLLVAAAYLLTRKVNTGRKRILGTAATFPFACVAFAGCWFVTYAVINTTVFNRDPGLGDGWFAPLPNGYTVEFIDVTDQGSVFRGPDRNAVSMNQDTLDGVRKLQITGKYLLGATDSGYFDRIGKESSYVDGYFLLDTSNAAVQKVKSLPELQRMAAAKHIPVDLKPTYEIYSQYRSTWFDYCAAVVLFGVPIGGFLLLARWIWQSHKQAVRGVGIAPKASDGYPVAGSY